MVRQLMSIPIQNIYFLLCYAWNKLDEKDRVAVSAEDYTQLLDLLAKALINSTRILLKRGIDRSYIDLTTEWAGVKGKIEMSQTVKSHLLLKQKTICSFDELSSNILVNRILVTTLNRLVRTEGLDRELKGEIKNLVWNFIEVESIDLSERVFNKIKLHRNNKFYGFALNICRLIHENSLLSEKTGEWQFTDFWRDKRKMNRLFEAFLFNFYTIEQRQFKVRRENIFWQFLSVKKEDLQYLPLMRTDITLENEWSKIIIDAKFYKETLKTNYDTEKISSSNLYQLFSYLLNQEKADDHKTQIATGILVYPTIDADYDLEFQYKNHMIYIRTLDLNANWKQINERLLHLLEFN